jgi:hypothetical protein
LLKQFGKDDRAGYVVITPNRTYRKKVHQQSTVFSTEQEAIIKAVWLTEGTQRDKVITTDSLSRLTAINGNNHTKNPKTIKRREMMDRNKKQINFCGYQETKKQMRKQRQRWMMTYNKMKNTPQTISKNRNDKDQKRAMEKRKNNIKGRKIEHGETRGMTRREQVVISRLRTGYTEATHGPRMNGITDQQCPFCDTGPSFDHVLWDCTETEQTKREMMMTLKIWTR